MTPAAFAEWGWRIPFLLSILLVLLSLYIRLRMKESPIFSTLKQEGKTSAAPVREALAAPGAMKRIALTLFGATAGQGVVWYTGQFYALFYLQSILKLEARTANIIVAIALLLAMPLFVVFGALSDRIGRKKIMMAGCLVAAVCYVPIYKGMVHASRNNVVAVSSTRVGDARELKLVPMTEVDGKPAPAQIASNPNLPLLVFLVFIQVVFVCMVYGPIAAYLVEAFPARIRYTSLSLPYHIGNGVFGGLLPVIGLTICAATGNLYAGLIYPIVVAMITFVVGTLFLRETRHIRIWDELHLPHPHWGEHNKS
jgi:MFS family permease